MAPATSSTSARLTSAALSEADGAAGRGCVVRGVANIFIREGTIETRFVLREQASFVLSTDSPLPSHLFSRICPQQPAPLLPVASAAAPGPSEPQALRSSESLVHTEREGNRESSQPAISNPSRIKPAACCPSCAPAVLSCGRWMPPARPPSASPPASPAHRPSS